MRFPLPFLEQQTEGKSIGYNDNDLKMDIYVCSSRRIRYRNAARFRLKISSYPKSFLRSLLWPLNSLCVPSRYLYLCIGHSEIFWMTRRSRKEDGVGLNWLVDVRSLGLYKASEVLP